MSTFSSSKDYFVVFTNLVNNIAPANSNLGRLICFMGATLVFAVSNLTFIASFSETRK